MPSTPTIEVRPLKSGETRYRVKIRYKGSSVPDRTFSTQAEAIQYAGEMQHAHQTGEYLSGQIALSDVLKRYVKRVLPHKKPRTQVQQRQQLAWWLTTLGDIPIKTVTRGALIQGREALLDRGVAPSTVNRYVAAISHVFSVAALDWELIQMNPVHGLKPLREPCGRVRFLGDDERQRLLGAVKASKEPALYPVVLLALTTGMRKAEILGLQWAQVDLQARVIRLEDTKSGERRAVPLVTSTAEMLHDHGRVQTPGESRLFPGRRGGETMRIDRPWAQAVKRAGLTDFRFHDLRHTAASTLAASGATLYQIGQILGHKSPQMTQRYSHLTDCNLLEVAERATAYVDW